MNEQPRKRTNPFDKPKFVDETPVQEESFEENEVEVIQQPQQVREEPVRTYQYVQQPQKQTRRQPKPQYIPVNDGPKDKYTATMDVDLRRTIKIYCATNGKMFSEFIEEACREKLLREGVK